MRAPVGADSGWARAASDGPLARSSRIVLFDLDDTLCDYAGARHRRLTIAFGEALAAIPPEQRPDIDALIARSIAVAPHGEAHFPDLLRAHGVGDERAIARAQSWFRANRLHGLDLFADAADVLRTVRAQRPDRRLGIITNGPADVQREKIERLALAPLLDVVLISGEVGIEKPDPRIFALALDKVGGLPSEAVYVGDAPGFDIAGAVAAGIRAVWLNRAGTPFPPDHPPPDAELRELSGLVELLSERI